MPVFQPTPPRLQAGGQVLSMAAIAANALAGGGGTANTLTISAPGTGTSGVALNVTGSVVPTSDAVQIALGASATTAPTTGFVSATNTAGALTGTLTPAAAGTFYAWAKDTVTGLTAVSGAITVSASSGSIAITSAPTTGTAGTALTTITGTVGPSGTAVQVQLGASATVAPTGSWTAATVSGTGWTATLTPASAGTFYIWAEQTATPSVQAVSAAVTVAAGSSGITMSLLSGSGNGGLVGDTFTVGTGAQVGENWNTTALTHTEVISPNIMFSGTGSGAISSATFWFDTSATNTTVPGSNTIVSAYNSGAGLSYNASNAGGIYPGNGTPGTYYGKYAFYNSSSVLLGVVVTNAITVS